jgi:hypothetical protein
MRFEVVRGLLEPTSPQCYRLVQLLPGIVLQRLLIQLFAVWLVYSTHYDSGLVKHAGGTGKLNTRRDKKLAGVCFAIGVDLIA